MANYSGEYKNCKICNTPLEFHPAGFRKDGTEYNEFWGCPKYKDEEHQKAKAQYKKPGSTNSEALIMEELAGINARLDKLIAFIVKKLGKDD